MAILLQTMQIKKAGLENSFSVQKMLPFAVPGTFVFDGT